MSLQQSTNWVRPLQASVLIQFPTEILLDIIEEINNDPRQGRDALDNLSQTCSRLYELARPYFFRADDFKQFYRAVGLTNITMMDRCEYYNAAAIDKLWRRPCQPHITTVDRLLSVVDEGWERPDSAWRAGIRDRKRDQTFNALKWLLERGADGEASMCNEVPFCNFAMQCGHMSTIFLTQLQRGTSKRGMEVIFNMMKMLSSHGYPNATRSDSLCKQARPSNDIHWFNTMVDYYTTSPLELALKSHVIPSVLELMLSEHADRDIKLRDWYDECPPSLAKRAARENSRGASTVWVEVSYIDRLIGTLHADLHNECTKWEENYFGEAADIFQAKLKLMIKYEMIDTSEEALLKSIETALYSIAADGLLAGGYDEEHFSTSWEKLCDAVKPFATDASLVQDPSTAPNGNGPGRIHRFAIDMRWNPWKQWLLREDASRRYDLLSESGEIDNVSSLVWESDSGEYERFFLPHTFDPDFGIPEWHAVSLDEWCASIPDSV
jgi:hypothetical protein